MTLSLQNIISTDNEQQTMTSWGSVLLQWRVDPCPAETLGYDLTDQEVLFSDDGSQVWQPRLIFENSGSGDFFTQQVSGRVSALIIPTTPNRTLFFNWNRVGTVESRCFYDLRTFLFDQLVSRYKFLNEQSFAIVSFGGILVNVDIGQIDVNPEWKFVQAYSKYNSTKSLIFRGEQTSFVEATVIFSRVPTYYLTNLLAPVYVLAAFIFASFATPIDVDRSAIVITLMLSIMVSQTAILDSVPKSPQSILFADYIQILNGIARLASLYHMLMLSVSE